MSTAPAFTVLTFQGEDFSIQQLLKSLHLEGGLRPLVAKAMVDIAIDKAIEQEKIEVTPEELQKAADGFRVSRRLSKAEDTQRWLNENQLTEDDFEASLRRQIARRKLIAKVTADKIKPFFEQNRDRFDRVALSEILVVTDGLANEIKSQITDDGADFAEMARKYSTEEGSKRNGGRRGVVPRKRLPPNIEAEVFAAKDGDVLGPFETNGKFLLLKVERLLPGRLNRQTAGLVQQQLFRLWVRQRVAAGKPEVKVFQHLKT